MFVGALRHVHQGALKPSYICKCIFMLYRLSCCIATAVVTLGCDARALERVRPDEQERRRVVDSGSG